MDLSAFNLGTAPHRWVMFGVGATGMNLGRAAEGAVGDMAVGQGITALGSK